MPAALPEATGAERHRGRVPAEGARLGWSAAALPTVQHRREFRLTGLQSHKAKTAKEMQHFSCSVTSAWVS